MLRFRFRSTPPDDYADRLAAEHDLTPEQARRMRLHNRLSDAGLDAVRVTAVRWAVEHGRIGEDVIDAVRDRVWPGLDKGEGY